MSTTPKLPGGKKAEEELTRLKYYWRDVLSASQKDFWRARFNSKDTQAAIREEIRVKLKFDLKYDKQITKLRRWDEMQMELDEEAQQQTDDERRVIVEFGPDATLDQIRAEVLKRSYARAIATGDFAAGRKTIVQDLNIQKVTLDRDKFEFDAAAAALKHAAALKVIANDKTLSEADKVNAARRKLFGTLPPQS